MYYRGLRLLLAGILPGAVAATLGAHPPPSTTTPPDEAVALVSWINGSAELRVDLESPTSDEDTPKTLWKRLELLDRMLEGSVIRTHADSEIQLVFLDGRRRVIEANSLAVIDAADAHLEFGSLRPLPAVPAVAKIPRLAEPGEHPGADRIRQEVATHASFEMSPSGGTLPLDAATLRFTPVDGIHSYRIEVVDAQGREVFATLTENSAVRLPEGSLEPAAVYFWRVTSERHGTHGGAFFATPDPVANQARQELAQQATIDSDPGLQVLLAEVDHRLGWTRRACQRLERLAVAPPQELFEEHRLARFGCEASTRVAMGTDPR